MPVDPKLYLTFVCVSALMSATPGPANLFSTANGMQRGKAAALVGMVGMNCGTLVWFAGAALGLGALVTAFPAVFLILRYVGAAYVAWLGIQSLLSAIQGGGAPAHMKIRPERSAFRDGLAVQLANPKALLFFTAVLPPFMDPARPAPPQLLMFAAAVILLDTVAFSAYGLFGAALAERLQEPRFRRIFAGITGLLLIGAATMIVIHR